MKQMVNRVTILILTVLFTIGLTACGTSTADSQVNASASGASASADAKDASGQAGDAKEETKPVKIQFWTIYTDANADANQKALVATLEKAKTDLPNIIIEHDATENEAYKTKIKTAIAAAEVPDVFYTMGAGFMKPFVESGSVLALDEYMNDGSKDKLIPGTTNYLTFDDKLYALPFVKWASVLYCNKELFENNGIKIPDTYEDLLTAVKAFRAAGITPITVGERDRWPGMFWQNAFALRTAGADACNNTLAKNTSFDQPEFAQSAAKLKELIDLKAFNDGCMGMTYDEGNAPFLEGQIPMYYMGDWFAEFIQADGSKVKDKIAVRNFPALSGGKGKASEFIGGSIDAFSVGASTKNKDEAVKAAKYIAEGMARGLNNSGTGMPAWNVPEPINGKVNPVFQQIKELTNSATGYVLAWDTFLEGADAEKHKDLVAQIFGGKISPEDFASGMQKLNEKK